MSLPDGWGLESIDEIARGGLFVDGDWVETKDQDPVGAVRLTQLADVGVAVFRDRSDRWMRVDQAEGLSCTYLLPNDILIARMPEPLGRACLVPESIGGAVTAVDVAILRVRREDLDPRYVMWAVNAPASHSQIVALQSGTTRKRISRRNLGTIRLPVPPLGEQRRIVEVLEDHLSRLDAADAALSASRDRLGSFRASCVAETFQAYPEGAVTAMRFGDRELLLPATWRESTVGEEAELVEYGSGSKASEARSPDAVPVLRMGNIKEGKVVWESLKYLPGGHLDVGKLRLRSGDLLFNRTNSAEHVGKCAVFEGEREATFASYLIRVRFRESVNPRWASLVVNSVFGRAYIKSVVSQQVGQANVNGTKLQAFPLPVPPRSVQDALLDTVSARDQVARRLSDQIGREKVRVDALRRSLLAAAFRGALVGEQSLAS